MVDLAKGRGDELQVLLGNVQKATSNQAAILHAQSDTVNVCVNTPSAPAAQAEENREDEKVMI
jgi:hypothetical protein